MNKSISTILLLMVLISCTSDSSTGYNDSSTLNKPVDYEDIFSTSSEDNDPADNFTKSLERLVNKLLKIYKGDRTAEAICFIGTGALNIAAGTLLTGPSDSQYRDSANFRDNYLLKSEKGNTYNNCYILLSNYAYNNNLVLAHPIKHLAAFNIGYEISQNLQYAQNDLMVLINFSDYMKFKEMIALYRTTENHEEIDSILDYLESDLNRFCNKPIAEIAQEFN